MKKLSLLCILTILCTSLASCDDTIVVNPGSTTGASDFTSAQTVEATQAPQTANHFTTTPPIAVNPIPSKAKQDIHYDSEDPDNYPEADFGFLTMRVLQDMLPVYEEVDLPVAICRITVRDIDYSQITNPKQDLMSPNVQQIPITFSIDKIFEKNAFFTETEGATISAKNFSCCWYRSDDAIFANFLDFVFPVAEIGEEYLVILWKNLNDSWDNYNLDGISVPLPSGTEISDAYFQEQLERIGIPEYRREFAQEALDRWFYPYIE